MFQGDHLSLTRTLNRAVATARELNHVRVGSEHLLLALTTATPAATTVQPGMTATAASSGPTALVAQHDRAAVSAILARHGVITAAVREAVIGAAPRGAGACADRDTLAPLGVDVDQVLADLSPSALDRPTGREPLLPRGATRARRRCARLTPPLGLDAQAAYEASLRLALARRDREHRPEHLALCLVALDPGVAWVLRAVHVETRPLLADLAHTFPPPTRNVLLRVERRLARRRRDQDLIRRYQRTTGRTVSSAGAVAGLIAG